MTELPPTTRPTMMDVAAEAGVGQATVSFVLNGREEMRISRETRKRVFDAAQKLGYRPRNAGRPPSALRPSVIGMMIDEVATSPFAMITIEGAQDYAWNNNAILEVAMTGADKSYEAAILQKWSQDKVQGIIFASIFTRQATPPDGLSMHRTVLTNCYDVEERFTSVVPAERRGGETATKALIDVGRKDIAYISGDPWMDASWQRQQGYERALAEAGIPFKPEYVVEGNFLPSGGRKATEKLLALPQPPDAIFCGNDLAAVGCYDVLREQGLKPGIDVAIVGYDNQIIAQHLKPSLSTVILPHRELGIWAAKAILSDGILPAEQSRLECRFVSRSSHLSDVPK